MGYEDFTTWTEAGADADTILTQTSSRSSWTDLRRDHDVYLYKDYGSGHFGDFDHLLELEVTSKVTDTSERVMVYPWVMTNNLSSGSGLPDGCFYIYVANSGAGYKITLVEKGGNTDVGTYIFTLGTRYYVQVVRSGTTLTCTIRTGSHSGTTVESLSITCSTTTFRYLEVPASPNFATDPAWKTTGYVESLDLQEGAAGEIDLSSSFVVQNSDESDVSGTLVVQKLGSAELSSLFIMSASFSNLSSTFMVEGFFIWDVIASPSSVQRSGTNTTELRCDWHDAEDLTASAYTCKLYVRGPPPDEDIYGPFTGSVTKEGAKEYNATYDWDPPAGADLGLYDLKAEVSK